MIRVKKKVLYCMLALLTMLAIGGISVAYGLTIQGHDQGRSGTKIYSDTWYEPGVKTNSKCDPKIKGNKWAIKCWSSVTEGKDRAYKATKKLTEHQAKSSKTGLQEAYASQLNNPLKSQKYNYNWSYL